MTTHTTEDFIPHNHMLLFKLCGLSFVGVYIDEAYAHTLNK